MKNVEEETLVRVGPGTPSGEVFRRYWLPVEVSANLGSGTRDFKGARNPIRVRVLCEDLVLFRDSSGRPGLLAEHCSHRGTSLYYGRVEENCIRCIYHGWLYDKEGNVVEMPGEPPTSKFKEKAKHRAYPCVEVGGLIFAYMGPSDKIPIFPKYDQLFRQDGIRVTGNGGYIEQCNVFQALHDNNLDPWHGEIAHSWFSPDQRDSFLHHGRDGEPPSPLKFERTPWGTRYVDLKSTTTPGEYEYHETHTVWPTQRCNRPGGQSMKWAVPVDDRRTRWFTVDFFPFVDGKPTEEAIRAQKSRFHIGYAENLPKDWAEQVGAWWNFDHPWRKGNLWEDEVCQATQGLPERDYFPDWEQWHLASSDEGLILNRRVWREQVETLRQGLDPIGVIRDSKDDKLIHIPSENKVVSREEGMRLFNMSVEERIKMVSWAER
jgi:phenylpropionate dioxygenase-like ring-hydroxylating dioxygenase large terminal subunit